MDMFILIFVLSFISVIGACIFHWWKERLKNKDAESVSSIGSIEEDRKVFNQYVDTEIFNNIEPLSTVCNEDFYKTLLYKDGADAQEKWKQSTPKHKTRIQNRNKRKKRNK